MASGSQASNCAWVMGSREISSNPQRLLLAGELPNSVSDANSPALNDPRVDPAKVHGDAFRRVGEHARCLAKPRREFLAAEMRLIADLDHGGTDRQLRPGRDVLGAEVEIDVELVAGESPT